MIEIRDRNIFLAELLSGETSSIYFSCVLEDSMVGRVWVNNLERPSFAVVWNEYQKGFQLMGKALEKSEYSSLRNFFVSEIFQFLKDRELNYFECGADNDELANMIFEIFEDRNIDSEQQKVFTLNQNPMESIKRVSNLYEIFAIDSNFFDRRFDNMEYVTEEIRDTWRTREAYLNNSYGYAAVIDSHIVSRALVTCSYKKHDNIGVDTIPEHRKKGISTMLVYKTLHEAGKRERDCVWDCTEDNIASEKTALKVGFQLERTYTICWFTI
ncbi:GNAT family N-acetyltransferase [Anaerocolumna sp. AGMB13020]|uniref:GNAT family N-acetyltransferase n=1 Tax=Anaerocolumna sp. AGMB13020 TaxID=3081750 RepID=UPI002954B903|nr:GNAT family N-acetyltransferase [Anaerocolumna sp. AGMB13020]WOO35266.1 GNAT family N-acetyltransferase [Anaerocolumna sp. AGMB13020]